MAYLPMHALFAVDVFSFRRPRTALALSASVILAGSLAWWTWPAAKAVRQNDTPPVAAARWILRNAYPGAGTIFVHNGMGPFAAYFLPGYEQHYFEHAEDVPYPSLSCASAASNRRRNPAWAAVSSLSWAARW